MDVLRRFYEDYCTRLGALAVRTFDDVERTLRKDGGLKHFLDQVWPTVRPESLVARLLSSPSALEEASEGILDDDERALLRRRGRAWSEADTALVDEAATLVVGPPRRFGHVIVDEAQDLTPMQLRMVGRRATHGFTVLGDVAQATGPVPYGHWDDVLRHLPDGGGADIVELRHAYRVPREIMEIAMPLLMRIAPGTKAPISYRTGADPARIVRGEPVLELALAEAASLASEDGLLAVIAPESLAAGHQGASPFDGARLPMLTPRAAKGLEFDHVVVVEPALIVEESTGDRGLRELYVALTRPTTTLVVVHSRPLPEALRAPLRAGRPADEDGASAPASRAASPPRVDPG
jgi:superfamily I DNA/RNA helicase